MITRNLQAHLQVLCAFKFSFKRNPLGCLSALEQEYWGLGSVLAAVLVSESGQPLPEPCFSLGSSSPHPKPCSDMTLFRL